MSEGEYGYLYARDPYEILAFQLGRYRRTLDPYKKAKILFDAILDMSEEEIEEAGISREELEQLDDVMTHVSWMDGYRVYAGNRLYIEFEGGAIRELEPDQDDFCDLIGEASKQKDEREKKMKRKMALIARKIRDFLFAHETAIPVDVIGEPLVREGVLGEERRRVEA